MTRDPPMTLPGRIEAVDALRGVAMLWMTAFHFCFDLNHFGHIHQNFYLDPFWTWQRSAIVSLFLLCAGLGQAIAVAQMQVERLKSQGFGNIVNENGVSGNITWAAQVANVSFGLDRLTVTTTWRNKAVVETLVVSDLISMR